MFSGGAAARSPPRIGRIVPPRLGEPASTQLRGPSLEISASLLIGQFRKPKFAYPYLNCGTLVLFPHGHICCRPPDYPKPINSGSGEGKKLSGVNRCHVSSSIQPPKSR